MKEPRAISEVVRRAETESGEELAAVRCNDGTYGIARDGKLLSGLSWPADERDEWLAFFDRFSKTSGWGGQPPNRT